MGAIADGLKGVFAFSTRLLNQPAVKEGVKNVASSVTFVFGIVEIFDIYQIACGRVIAADPSVSSKWMQVVNKILVICAKTSLILSAGVSRPGVFVISFLMGSLFSTAQLDRVFGPNTIFVINPRHPRHIISIVAAVLALPTTVQSMCKSMHWVYKKIKKYKTNSTGEIRDTFSENKIRLMVLFNIVTSRPTLHIGNRICQIILRR